MTAAAITQFERNTARPTNTVLAELALALGMPTDFFRQGRPIEQVPASASHFRSLRATPAIARDQALAFAEIALAVIDVIEQYVELPSVPGIAEPVDGEPDSDQIVAIAANTRSRMGVGLGPIPHVVRLLEAHGIVVLRLPPEVDGKVDAFSTEAGHRPLVLLSPAKDDRARSRFDAAHELGHLVMHQDVQPGSKIIESQANQFASEFLAPTPELEPDLPRKVDWEALLLAMKKWGISLAALVYRARGIGLCVWGGVPMWLSSRSGRGVWMGVPVVGLVAEHGEQDVAAAPGQADQRGVVFLPFIAFPLVVGPAGGIGQGRERSQEERSFEFAVAGSGRVFALDGGARTAGDWGDS
ncbi:protein of unknown function, partial [Saccharopolyspora shandongensis]